MEFIGTNSKGQKVWGGEDYVIDTIPVSLREFFREITRSSPRSEQLHVLAIAGAWHQAELAKEINAVLDELEEGINSSIRYVRKMEDARNLENIYEIDANIGRIQGLEQSKARIDQIRTRISKNNLTTESGKEGS